MYPEDYNYCSFHDIAVELVYPKELVKVCRACGAKYTKEDNFCNRCEYDEPLIIIDETKRDIEIHEIPFTPNFNPKNYPNTFRELDELLSDENIKRLLEFNLLQTDFDEIISNIQKTYKNNLDYLIDEYIINLKDIDITEKMILFCKSFVKMEYKEVGGDLGHFEFNKIHVDDRLETPLLITTIIHEIAHFILSEILEQIVQTLLECNKTDALEAFVLHCLSSDVFNELVDEYCAHTVEGRYVPFGYQDYSSYKFVLRKFLEEYDEEWVELAKLTGNTFAFYIKSIISTFIDESLREEIKEEYDKLNDPKNYGEALHEIDRFLQWDEFRECLKEMLTRNLDKQITDFDAIRKMYAYSFKFSQNNE